MIGRISKQVAFMKRTSGSLSPLIIPPSGSNGGLFFNVEYESLEKACSDFTNDEALNQFLDKMKKEKVKIIIKKSFRMSKKSIRWSKET
jgi:hypothetical protein